MILEFEGNMVGLSAAVEVSEQRIQFAFQSLESGLLSQIWMMGAYEYRPLDISDTAINMNTPKTQVQFILAKGVKYSDAYRLFVPALTEIFAQNSTFYFVDEFFDRDLTYPLLGHQTIIVGRNSADSDTDLSCLEEFDSLLFELDAANFEQPDVAPLNFLLSLRNSPILRFDPALEALPEEINSQISRIMDGCISF
ncbi:MAG: hypothetical protein WBA28_04100 [Microbacteriaceae bacterium]